MQITNPIAADLRIDHRNHSIASFGSNRKHLGDLTIFASKVITSGYCGPQLAQVWCD